MACETFERRLHEYFDRELDASGRDLLMEHLRDCGSCRWDFKLYRKMFQTMEQMEVESPAGLSGSIMEAIRKISFVTLLGPRKLGFFASPASYGLAAAAVFLVAVVVGWHSQVPDPLRAPVTARMVNPGPVATALAPPPVELAAAPGVAETEATIRVIPEGRVEVMRKGNLAWEAIRPGDRVGYEDRIRTASEASARLEYPDRTYVRIKSQSLVQILDQALRVYQGDTWIKVEKKGSRFEARTPNAVASVRGTIFAVKVDRAPLDRAEILRIAEQGATDGTLGTAGTNAPLSATGTPLTLAHHLRATLLKGFKTEVSVFESVVAVSPVDPRSGVTLSEVLLKQGQATSVAGTELAAVRPLEAREYYAWNLPPPADVLARGEAVPMPGASSTVTGDGVLAPTTGERPALPVGTSTTPIDGAASEAAGRPGEGSVGFESLRDR